MSRGTLTSAGCSLLLALLAGWLTGCCTLIGQLCFLWRARFCLTSVVYWQHRGQVKGPGCDSMPATSRSRSSACRQVRLAGRGWGGRGQELRDIAGSWDTTVQLETPRHWQLEFHLGFLLVAGVAGHRARVRSEGSKWGGSRSGREIWTGLCSCARKQ